MTKNSSQVDTEADETQVVETEIETAPLIAPEAMKEELSRARREAARYRVERNELTKQLKDLTGQLEESSKAKKSLEEISAQLEDAEHRAIFLEEALSHECRNPKAAFAVAKADSLFTRAGSPDWDAIRKAAPELFGKAVGEASAGAGTGAKPPAESDMNAWIRRQAGRQTL